MALCELPLTTTVSPDRVVVEVPLQVTVVVVEVFEPFVVVVELVEFDWLQGCGVIVGEEVGATVGLGTGVGEAWLESSEVWIGAGVVRSSPKLLRTKVLGCCAKLATATKLITIPAPIETIRLFIVSPLFVPL